MLAHTLATRKNLGVNKKDKLEIFDYIIMSVPFGLVAYAIVLFTIETLK
jgi:hypothetical protein